MTLRLIIGFAQGAFTAAPYIIVSLINERKDVPKAMGMLATAIAVGGFGGSIIAGILTDMGLLTVAIIMPSAPLILGIILIGLNLPNQKRDGKVTIDVPGIIALVIALCGILLALNFGSSIGFTNPYVILGFVIGIIGVIGLIKVEEKASEPLIPLHLFKNKNYTVLLLVGFICYFYQTAMTTYAPIASMQVMGSSTSIAGALQMPRTIITIVLPTIAGAWVGKKSSNAWKAMAISTLLAALPMAVMGFTTPSTSVMLYFIALAVTGISESFRAVSITPSAQAALSAQDMGVGTSLVNFVNSLALTISGAICGVAYNLKIAADSTSVQNIQSGVNSVFMLSAVVSIIGFLIVIFVVKPLMTNKEKAKSQDDLVNV
jgi:MFS family permease